MTDHNLTHDMISDNKEVKGNNPEQDLSSSAMKSIQGTGESVEGKTLAEKIDLTSTDPNLQTEMEEWKRTHDPANWEYHLGSPHADYQANKDLNEAKVQHKIGIQASTASDLSDTIDTTLKAHIANKEMKETPGDKYFREKYGPKPYTTDAYTMEEV